MTGAARDNTGGHGAAFDLGGGLFAEVRDLGRVDYRTGYAAQESAVEEVLRSRESGDARAGVVFLVEHDPVITVSRRPGAGANLIATPQMLAREGVALEETDRGGDITYHGPGQLVVYPILDLNRLNLRLHDYMRVLEEAIIRSCAALGLDARREQGATGVWIGGERKVCAMGVRVRRWVSMHGLALNVTTNLAHFRLIVPCGLVRPVTSLSAELGVGCPSWDSTKGMVVARLGECVRARSKSP